MDYLKENLNYNFNVIFTNYRGISIIKEYFRKPYNKAITKLTEEGYDLLEVFEEIALIIRNPII